MTTKELFDQRKAEHKALYLSIRDFKREARAGRRGQRLGAMIKFTDKKGVEKDILYVPYTQYTKINTSKKFR